MSNIVNSVSWSLAEKVISFGATMVISIVLARLIAPSEYGTIALVTVFVEIFTTVLLNGIGSALIQKKQPTQMDYNTINVINISFAIGSYLLLYIAAPYISDFYGEDILCPVTRVLSLIIPFAAISSVQFCYLQKNMQFSKYCIVTLGCTILSGTSGIMAAYMGFGIWALVVYYIGKQLFQSLLLILVSGLKLSLNFSKHSAKELLPYGLRTMATTFVGDLETNLRSLIVGKAFTPADLAFYNMGGNYPKMIISNISTAVGRVMFPVFSDIQGDNERYLSSIRKAVRLNSFVIVPAIAGLAAVAHPFFFLLYTDKWLASVPYLQILSLAYIARPYENVCNYAIMGSGRSNIILIDMIITKVLSIILILVAVFILDSVLFIAWGVAVTSIIGVLLFAWQSKRFFNYTYIQQLKDTLPIYLISMLMYIVIQFINKSFEVSVLSLIVEVIIGGVIYVGCSYIFRIRPLTELLILIKK